MTTPVDIANRALAEASCRTGVTAVDGSDTSKEGKSVAKFYDPTRKQVLRMAPWNTAFNYNSAGNPLKSAPGTPENPTGGTSTWDKTTQPPPGWNYEYSYPTDCLRLCWIIPQFDTGFAGGVPITTAVTGAPVNYWYGPPVRFRESIDQFGGVDTRVILTNQENAILAYIKDVTLPDVWDDLLQEAIVAALASRLAIDITGNRALATDLVAAANRGIALARATDGNEGITVNDVAPDWLRVRGIAFDPAPYSSPGFDWGPMFAGF